MGTNVLCCLCSTHPSGRKQQVGHCWHSLFHSQFSLCAMCVWCARYNSRVVFRASAGPVAVARSAPGDQALPAAERRPEVEIAVTRELHRRSWRLLSSSLSVSDRLDCWTSFVSMWYTLELKHTTPVPCTSLTRRPPSSPGHLCIPPNCIVVCGLDHSTWVVIVFQTATVIINCLFLVNFAVNFVLYCVVNVQFRRTARDVISAADLGNWVRSSHVRLCRVLGSIARHVFDWGGA